MNKLQSIFIALAITCIGCSSPSEEESSGGSDDFASNSVVILNSDLQSNMVLQQNSSVPIRGLGTASEKVRVECSWDSKAYDVTVPANGEWLVKIPTPAASKTPQEITVRGRLKYKISNILIGEVWVCAGQSNMFWMLKDATNGAQEVAGANYPNIRIMNMPRVASETPVETHQGKWQICSPATIAEFSAVGYLFGRKLLQDLDIPIGLIGANWGNTAAEVWGQRSLIMNNATLAVDAAKQEAQPHSDGSPHKVGSAYNAMIYPLRHMPIVGMIWYQGENNQGAAYNYPLLLKTIVDGWRSDWGRQFPFYISQICPYKRDWDYETKYSNPAMRFMQSTASQQITNSGVTVNDDIANITDIHPTNKQDVAMRLAWLALNKTYGKSNYDNKIAPTYDHYTVEGDKFTVYFNNAAAGLKSSDSAPLTMFEIAGEDKVFHPAVAKIAGSAVELTSASVATPVAARMGWSYTKITNLRNSENLPVSVFRTYSWTDEQEEK